ncbi:DUF2194 domain-containing protein [Paenibacillus sp. Marseille-P2973]|uniref:DUF2194 domain-containing protein n=1 Tax=Paenibacillus sp. Marseille-P2973 TaxID=1871032 RepID=UPI001B38726B|nr:DUF2194 domain-containing protein [Paenibacillus sp. Marseille-P2973]
MKDGFNLKRNVYVILAAVIVLALALQIARSQYVLQFSRNGSMAEERQLRVATAEEIQALEFSGPDYCIFYDSEDEYSVSVKNNTSRMLQYMKKNTAVTDTSSGSAIRLEGCAAAIITNQQLDPIGNILAVSDYVQQGGYVLFTSQLETDSAFYQLYRKLGIVSVGGTYPAKGIELNSNILIGEKGYKSNDPYFVNISNVVEIDGRSELLASAMDGNPLIWRTEYGDGAFLVMNGTMLQEKVNRGLFSGAISMLEPDYIYPVFNSKLIYIDDFPSPIPEGSVPSIYDVYHKDIKQFYREIWWPDMLKAAKRAGLKYTAGIIQSYQNDVEGPFQYPADEDRYNLISYGREVIKSGGEIGIHGYNHQSLQTDLRIADYYEYKVWKSQEKMEQAVAEVLEFAHRAFPNYQIMSYIPPSNMLDSVGREALKQAWPNLTVISSLYEEDINKVSYVQEFEVAPDGIIEMPRISSGYMDSPFEQWAEANAITSLGFYSHFIHPDDILDEMRGQSLSWEELYKGFTLKLERLRTTYPWLRAMTSTEAALDMEDVLGSTVSWEKGANSIKGEVSHLEQDNFFILRTERRIGRLQNCTVTKIDDQVFLVTVTEDKFEIGLGD